MKKLFFSLVVSGALLLATLAQAASTSAGIGINRGQGDSMAYSLNVTQRYTPWVENENLEVGPLAEIGAHLWVPEHGDNVFGAYLAPGVRIGLNTNAQIQPYIEGSVGGAVNSDNDLDDRELGSNVLFRTRGSVGVAFGDSLRHRVQGDYINHSTWGLTNKNDGYDTYGISYGYSF